MGVKEKEMLCEELQKNELCNNYWSEQMESELRKDIQLEFEPVGDMAIYSKYFEFHTPYSGDREELFGTTAVIKLGITAKQSVYDIKKAIAGTDCYHNVKITVGREGKVLATVKFRLWSGEEAEYSGNEMVLKLFFQN